MTLNSEGLEKAVRAYDDALNNPVFVECKKCQGTGYHHGFGETGHDPDWCLKCGGSQCVLANGEDTRPLRSAISAYLSALPPVDRLEVVGWQYRFEMWNGDWSGWTWVGIEKPTVPEDLEVRSLVALSQASSVIAGLRAERITAERDALDAYGKLQAAEARISSLEEEIKRLREALEPFAEVAEKDIGGSEHENDLFQPMQQHNRAPRLTVGHLRTARQALEDHNG